MLTVLYVSGPMSGLPGFNFPAFNKAAAVLRAAGYVVINPAENWGGATDVPRATCMRLDIQEVLASDGLALLDGWEHSPGANLEYQIARQLGLQARPWEDWL